MPDRRQPEICASYGQVIAPPTTGLRLPPIKQRIFDAVKRRPGITAAELRDWVWADDIDGGPLTDTKCLHCACESVERPARSARRLCAQRRRRLPDSKGDAVTRVRLPNAIERLVALHEINRAIAALRGEDGPISDRCPARRRMHIAEL